MRDHRGGLPLVTSLLLTLLAGCRTAEGPSPTRNPVVLREPAADVDPEEGTPAPDIMEATAPVEALMAAGRHPEALDEISAMEDAADLEDAADSERLLARLAALRLRIKQRLIQTRYVDASIALDAHRISLGMPITGEIVLRNLGQAELVIPKSSANATNTTLLLQARYVEHDPDGTVLREIRQTPRVIGEDIRLEPGAAKTWPLVIDSLDFGPGSINYRTYTLEATLYPAAIRIGGEDYPGNLTFEPKLCEVFPRNYEHLAARPVARLLEALQKNSPPHVCLAAALVPQDSRRRAVGHLLDALAEQGETAPRGPTRQACCVALRLLTGQDEPTRPDAWLAWGRGEGYETGRPR